jgi:hypothetical protein
MTDPTLDRAALWNVWLGNYTNPVLLVAPLDATLDHLAQAAKVAMHDRFQSEARPEHADHDRTFWTDAVAAVEVTKIERGDLVWLSPHIVAAPASAAQRPRESNA